jgi:hypothetical protein
VGLVRNNTSTNSNVRLSIGFVVEEVKKDETYTTTIGGCGNVECGPKLHDQCRELGGSLQSS